MFRRMKLSLKIATGFGCIIIISMVLAYVGWNGVHQVRSYMGNYALWGSIDKVMDSKVAINVLGLENAINKYHLNPTEENIRALNSAFDKAVAGVAEWSSLVRDYPELSKVAVTINAQLAKTKELIEGVVKFQNLSADIKAEWDAISLKMLAFLETTMEEVIDPAKEKAEQARDIPTMVKWSAIDMVMNEAVIANALKLQTAAHDYAARPTGEHWTAFLNARKQATDGLEEWKSTLAGAAGMEQAAARIASDLDAYNGLSRTFHTEVGNLVKMEQSSDRAMSELFAALDHAMTKVIDPAKQAQMTDARTAQQKASILAIAFGIGCVLFGILLAVVVTRSITGPISRIIASLDAGAVQVAAASEQLSAASQSLAEGSSEQAASIEETSSALEEMSSMTKLNADHAGEADGLMNETKRITAAAGDFMEKLSASMLDIDRASAETSKIIKTIDEIAFQTNLLALNAAVEAARAGEAGAGFAVVANEVRNLAMRAAEAAQNTSALIEGTTQKIQGGSELARNTHEAFAGVSESAMTVADLVSEIAAASKEQAQGIGQVNTTISAMDRITQRNAASAEESASASEEMSAQAVRMREIVAQLVALVDGQQGDGPGRRYAELYPHAGLPVKTVESQAPRLPDA